MKETVFEALDNAVTNGYDPRLQSVERSVVDLIDMVWGLEDADPLLVEQYVEEWLEHGSSLGNGEAP